MWGWGGPAGPPPVGPARHRSGTLASVDQGGRPVHSGSTPVSLLLAASPVLLAAGSLRPAACLPPLAAERWEMAGMTGVLGRHTVLLPSLDGSRGRARVSSRRCEAAGGPRPSLGTAALGTAGPQGDGPPGAERAGGRSDGVVSRRRRGRPQCRGRPRWTATTSAWRSPSPTECLMGTSWSRSGLTSER